MWTCKLRICIKDVNNVGEEIQNQREWGEGEGRESSPSKLSCDIQILSEQVQHGYGRRGQGSNIISGGDWLEQNKFYHLRE